MRHKTIQSCQRVVLAIVLFAAVAGADVRFSVTPDRTQTTLKQPLRVTATVVSDKDLGRLPIPKVSSAPGFKVLRVDRNQSSSSSTSFVNGRVERNVEITYYFYYTVAPQKLGSFTFPSLSLTVEGKTYTTDPFTVKVLERAPQSADIVARITCTKRSLYVGEQAVLSVKVGQKPGASVQLTNEGFRSFLDEIMEEAKSSFSLTDLTTGKLAPKDEILNGQRYAVYTVRLGLVPLSSGKHRIPAAQLPYNTLKRVRQRGYDPFQDFFGGSAFGRGYQAQPASVLSNGLTLEVQSLPAAPTNFSGIVGSASLSADVNPRSVATGDAVTLKVAIRGTARPGSLAELELPELPNIEVFSPEKQTYADTTPSGVVTRSVYKYLLIPRTPGALTIPPIQVSYFDSKAGTYRTLSSDTFELSVSKGSGDGPASPGRYLSRAEIREVGRDIRYIKLPERIRGQMMRPHRNMVLYLVNLIPLCMVVFALLYRVQANRHSRDPSGVLRRRAYGKTRSALASLGKEDKLSDADFAAKLSGAVEGYISQRYGIGAHGMTLDDLDTELRELAVEDDTRQRLRDLLSKADAYRFAAGAFGSGSRNEMIAAATDVVGRLENQAKGKRQ